MATTKLKVVITARAKTGDAHRKTKLTFGANAVGSTRLMTERTTGLVATRMTAILFAMTSGDLLVVLYLLHNLTISL